MAKRLLLVVAIALTILSALPLAGVLVASGLANALGCQLNEASVHPCVVLGVDIGSVLSVLFVMGWLMLATGPILVVAMLGWLVFGLTQVARAIQRGHGH